MDRRADYRAWGWEALVQENGLVTLATVPAIGARVMEYGLGAHRSIYVNDAEAGKVYQPRVGAPWPNYGGYKVWPAPQASWGWPPPPILDAGVYEAQVVLVSPDSTTIRVSSPVEQWKTPGLRLERRLTMFRGASRVRVEQTLVNESATPARWSVWDVTQSVVNHPGLRDFESFWVYFPLNPQSRYGARGVRVSAESKAWKGEVAPGVFGVQYMPEAKKIFADSHLGWVCYVDEAEGYAYAKTFPVTADAEYPDDGAHVEVWLNNDPLLYLEVEVVSPIVEVAANGGRYTFTEDWWAARVCGPILSVNEAGAISRRLSVDLETNRIVGTYGVFHVGVAQAVFVGGYGAVLGRGEPHGVTPLESLELAQPVAVPRGTARVEVRLTDPQGRAIGVLDAVGVPAATGVLGPAPGAPSGLRLEPASPNPFNSSATIA